MSPVTRSPLPATVLPYPDGDTVTVEYMTRLVDAIRQADSTNLKRTGDIDFGYTFAGEVWDDGGAVYNVKHPKFGAVGDGTTDDTDAIQAAMTAAGVAGGCVLFPPGSYRYSEDIVLPNLKAVALKGAGVGVSILLYEGTGYAIDTETTGVAANGRGHAVEDLTIQGYGTTVTWSSVSYNASSVAAGGVRLRLLENASFSNVHVFGFTKTGSYGLEGDATSIGGVIGLWRNKFSNVRVEACASGIKWTGASGNGQPNENTFIHVKATFPTSQATGACWSISEGDNNVFVSCEADGRCFTSRTTSANNNLGFHLTNAAGASTTRYLTFINPRAEHCSYGLQTDAYVNNIAWINPAYFSNSTGDENIASGRSYQVFRMKQNGGLPVGEFYTAQAGLNFFVDADANGSGEHLTFWRDADSTGSATKMNTWDSAGHVLRLGATASSVDIATATTVAIDDISHLELTNTGGSTVTNFTGTNGAGITKGHRLVIELKDGNTTFADGTKIFLAGGTNYNPPAGSTIEFVCTGFTGGDPIMKELGRGLPVGEFYTAQAALNFFVDADANGSGESVSFWRDADSTGSATKMNTMDSAGHVLRLGATASAQDIATATTIAIDDVSHLELTNTGGSTVTNFTGTNGAGVTKGHKLVVELKDGNTTFADGTKIFLAGGTNYNPPAGSTIEFVCTGFTGGAPIMKELGRVAY